MNSSGQKVESPAQLIDARIKELGDWRGKALSRLRGLIKEADPDVVEEWKWRKPSHPGVPAWSHQGLICTGETYKSVVKLTFFKGASLKDPSGLFNSSLGGNTRRAIDFREDDEIDEKGLRDSHSSCRQPERVLLSLATWTTPSGGPACLREHLRYCVWTPREYCSTCAG